MALVATDWSVTRSTKAVRYIGDDHGGALPSYATTIELHRWLGDLADNESSSGDDQLDKADLLASIRNGADSNITMVNGYNIDDNASEHIYAGSITQLAGDEIYDGFVNYGNAGIVIQLIQDAAVLTDDWWNANGGLNANLGQGISHQFMIKVRTGGADIDGRRILGISREFNKTYAEFFVNGTARGNNTLALANVDDLNNQTASGTVAGWSGITNLIEGYSGLDVNADGSDEYYYSKWDRDAYTINQFYERTKYMTRDGSGFTMYGLSGELFRGITHEIVVDTPTGTFSAFEAVSWTGGTGQMLAINSTTAATKMWIQYLTGVLPTDGLVITGGTSGATVAMDTTITAEEVSKPFIGSSTGSALIGAFGIGVEVSDLTKDDKLTDLDGNLITPPNLVTFTLAGLVSGEDSPLVGPWDGVTLDPQGNPAIEKDQFSLNTTLSGAAETAVVVGAAIPTDTPSAGTIRIQLNSTGKRYKLQAYTSWTGSTSQSLQVIIVLKEQQQEMMCLYPTLMK